MRILARKIVLDDTMDLKIEVDFNSTKSTAALMIQKPAQIR
ncbi:MAG: hypothetical protein JWN25_245 [Verrucomicrobiales bacterium]|nr:hypothetical protein [Verrucomicrobiales bacterium]